jgi:hypothetical protein
MRRLTDHHPPCNVCGVGVTRSRFSALFVAIVLAVSLAPATALAAEPTSSYGSQPPPPETPKTQSSTPTPPPTAPVKPPAPQPEKTGTSPGFEEGEKPHNGPAGGESPISQHHDIAKAATLPFTGLDLRWDVGFGVLLIAAGASLMAAQRRYSRQR